NPLGSTLKKGNRHLTKRASLSACTSRVRNPPRLHFHFRFSIPDSRFSVRLIRRKVMQSEQQFIDGKIVRGEAPLNLEMPFETLDGFITPTKSFYVRTHFPIPKIDKNKWRLRIEGEVEKPFEIDYHELTKLAWKKVPVTLECAGNNRNFLEPKVKGVQWGLGA